MRFFLQCIKEIHPFSKTVLQIGLALMIEYYIIARLAIILRPYAANPFAMSAVCTGCLEAAPAALAACVLAALLCDLALRRP